MIDRLLLQHHLAQAEKAVARSEQHVARHRAIVAELERVGRGAKASREVLKQFELLLANHIADRDRWRGDLKDKN